MATQPVGLAKCLSPQGVMRAEIGDLDLAIWRSASGKISAWGNRCPHRGMRLSHGFVRGESLACAYHGWHYNCSGVCHYIPAHPELEPPATIKTASYSVVEQHGVIWVDANGVVDPPPLPDDCMAVRSLTLECELETAINAFSVTSLQDQHQDELSIVAPDGNQKSASPKVIALANSNSCHVVIVLFQPVAAARVTSHILAKNNTSPSFLVSISRWSESVRRQAEQNT